MRHHLTLWSSVDISERDFAKLLQEPADSTLKWLSGHPAPARVGERSRAIIRHVAHIGGSRGERTRILRSVKSHNVNLLDRIARTSTQDLNEMGTPTMVNGDVDWPDMDAHVREL